MMPKQEKFSTGFSFELARMLKEGATLEYYYNKNAFDLHELNLSRLNFDVCKFDAIPYDLCDQMIKAGTEFEQGKLLYESLSQISLRDASDIDFWNYLAHKELYRYIHHRWPDIKNPPNKSTPENYVLNHWIMTSSSQASLIDYPLSGLWWSFHISKVNNWYDPYYLTKVLFKNQHLRTKGLGQAKYARHKPAVVGILEFIKDNKLDDNNLEDNARAIIPYVNLLGGTQLLSFFDKKWFKDRLEDQFHEDIRKYGRLFRRESRPTEATEEKTKKDFTKLTLDEAEKRDQTDLGSRQKDTSRPSVDNSNSLDKERTVVLKHLNLLKQGGYSLTLKPLNDAIESIPIEKRHENGFLYLFYNDGRVSKTSVKQILAHSKNTVYAITAKLRDTYIRYELSEFEKHVGISHVFMSDDRVVSVFSMQRMATYKNPLNRGKKIAQYTNQLHYKLISPADADRFPILLTKDSSRFIRINDKGYKDQLAELKKVWPEIFEC